MASSTYGERPTTRARGGRFHVLMAERHPDSGRFLGSGRRIRPHDRPRRNGGLT